MSFGRSCAVIATVDFTQGGEFSNPIHSELVSISSSSQANWENVNPHVYYKIHCIPCAFESLNSFRWCVNAFPMTCQRFDFIFLLLTSLAHGSPLNFRTSEKNVYMLSLFSVVVTFDVIGQRMPLPTNWARYAGWRVATFESCTCTGSTVVRTFNWNYWVSFLKAAFLFGNSCFSAASRVEKLFALGYSNRIRMLRPPSRRAVMF